MSNSTTHLLFLMRRQDVGVGDNGSSNRDYLHAVKNTVRNSCNSIFTLQTCHKISIGFSTGGWGRNTSRSILKSSRIPFQIS